MPTYDYRCEDCGHRFEHFQSMKDEPLKVCPECSGKVKRLIGTGAGIIFKGSGFYETDYRSDSYKKSAAKETSAGTEKSGTSGVDKKTQDSSKNNSAKTSTEG